MDWFGNSARDISQKGAIFDRKISSGIGDNQNVVSLSRRSSENSDRRNVDLPGRRSIENSDNRNVVSSSSGDGGIPYSSFGSEIVAKDGSVGEKFISEFSEEISSACIEATGNFDREEEVVGSTPKTDEPRLSREDSTALAQHVSNLQLTGEVGGKCSEFEKPPSQVTAAEPMPLLLLAAGTGDVAEAAEDGSISDIDDKNLRTGDRINAASGRQSRPREMGELAEKLSDRLGIAVATVFYEVMEQNREFGSKKARVDDLSKLLAAAMKESLVRVLVGHERTVFLENFKNSFISTYKTIRSVRSAFQVSSGSKSRRSVLNHCHRDLDARCNVDNQKKRSVVDRSLVTSNWLKKNTASHVNPQTHKSEDEVKSASEEDMISLGSTTWPRNDDSDAAYGSNKSCLDESLQLSVVTSSYHEDDGFSDNSESRRRIVMEGSLKSSSFASSNRHERRSNGRSSYGGTDSSLSKSTPNSRRTRSERKDSECESQDDDMFSAKTSSDSETWVMVTRNESVSTVRDPAQWMPPRQTEAFRQYGALADQLTKGRDILHENIASSLSRSWVAGSSDIQRDHIATSQRRTHVPENRKHAFRGGVVNALGEHCDCNRSIVNGAQCDCHPSHVGVPGTKEESGESPIWSPESGSHPAINEARILGRSSVGQEVQAGTMSTHRWPRQHWGELTQHRRSAFNENLIPGVPPFFDYGGSVDRHHLFQRSVEAQETCNYLRSLELAQSMKRLSVKEDHLQLQGESNILMRENVGLTRSKAEFKELALEDRKLKLAYEELSNMCADELVAGLCVMIFALAWGAWRFSYVRLSKIVAACNVPPAETRRSGIFGTNWMYSSWDIFAWQFKILSCEFTKAGRMLAGLALIAFITTVLLRRGTASSSQAMPATIIAVVLGGVCGYAGKISIDSLGGSGFHWLILWESLCLLHILVTCCTPLVHKYLYGLSSALNGAKASHWLKFCSVTIRFVFHTLILFGLPVMAGLLPFASPHELKLVFWEMWGFK